MTSKYEKYDTDQRLADLKNIVDVQCEADMTDVYLRGMANGLLLAWSIVNEPYGAEVPYFDKDGAQPKEAARE